MLKGEALWSWKSDCGAGLHFFFFFKVLTTKVFIPELERAKPSSLAPVRAAALVGVGTQGKAAYTITPQHTHPSQLGFTVYNGLFKIQNYSFTHLNLHSAQGAPGSCCHMIRESFSASPSLQPPPSPSYRPSPSSPPLLLLLSSGRSALPLEVTILRVLQGRGEKSL